MRHENKPLGFECYWSAGGRMVIKQDQTSSSLRGQDKEPMLYFDAEELPRLIDSLRRAVGEEVIPDLQAETQEFDDKPAEGLAGELAEALGKTTDETQPPSGGDVQA